MLSLESFEVSPPEVHINEAVTAKAFVKNPYGELAPIIVNFTLNGNMLGSKTANIPAGQTKIVELPFISPEAIQAYQVCGELLKPEPRISDPIVYLRTGPWNSTYWWCNLASYWSAQLKYAGKPLLGRTLKFYISYPQSYMFSMVTKASTTLTDCQGQPLTVPCAVKKGTYTPNQTYLIIFEGDDVYAPTEGRWSYGPMPPY